MQITATVPSLLIVIRIGSSLLKIHSLQQAVFQVKAQDRSSKFFLLCLHRLRMNRHTYLNKNARWYTIISEGVRTLPNTIRHQSEAIRMCARLLQNMAAIYTIRWKLDKHRPFQAVMLVWFIHMSKVRPFRWAGDFFQVRKSSYIFRFLFPAKKNTMTEHGTSIFDNYWFVVINNNFLGFYPLSNADITVWVLLFCGSNQPTTIVYNFRV